MPTLGEIIKDYRNEHHLSLRDFASKCDLSFSYVSMLEKNKDPRGNPIVPTIATINKVAEAMNLSFEDVFYNLDGNAEIKVNSSIEPPSYTPPEYETDTNWMIDIEEKYHSNLRLKKYAELFARLNCLNEEGLDNVDKYLDMMIKSGDYTE